jgi:hypothetical protein
MTISNDTKNPHRWTFFRSGGFDQVSIETGDDLRHLDELDPKLWTVLSCPTTGLEFDARTLALMDTDGDGQIRVPEILAAVRFACETLKDPQALFGDGALPLEAIDDSRPEGARLKAAAAKVLGYLGKPEATALEVGDFADTTKLFTAGHANGDGVVPAALAGDEALAKAIADIIAMQGGTPDRSGEPGITKDSLEAFFRQADEVLAWRAKAAADPAGILPLGEGTAAAAAAFDAVQAKVDDWFTRCRLAEYDARAGASLNPAAETYGALATHTLAAGDAAVAALPLATVAAGQPLPLSGGLNPAWAAQVAALRDQVVAPLLGARDALTAADWAALSAKFAAYRAWLAAKPTATLHDLDTARLEQLRSDGTRERLAALIEQDLSADASAGTIDALERLVRYQRDLLKLLRNFVTLSDFYGGRDKAVFQAGTLYLDQRSCDLVLRVADMGKHATLAPFSGCFLVYCQCTRAGSDPINILAALTGGGVDELLVVGRNGLFYDRAGRDWRATVVKVVEQPVSIRQAFWSPYRRIASFVENQIRKFAASRDKDVETKATTHVGEAGAKAEAGQVPAPAQPFDIAKFAGIFAAIGLAVGAIGTALAAAIGGLFALNWWQLPLAIVGILLAISAPSMLLAYMTLRRRSLGPLLDANGWALNARARINLPFGGSLTQVAELPAGSSRSLADPFAEKRRPWKSIVFLLALAAAAFVAWRRGMFGA